jgi:NADPH-dependent curcumin reductase CurA
VNCTGKIKWKETVFDDLENAPKSIHSSLDGENFGKILVKIGPD